MWTYLPNLKELYLQALPAKFNDGFLKLKKLHTLSLSGNVGKVNLGNINNDTFESLRLSPIEQLDLSGCNILYFDGQAFQYLSTLNWLSVANNPLGSLEFANMASGFSLLSLRHLDLNGTMSEDEIQFLWFGCYWASGLTSLTFPTIPLIYSAKWCHNVCPKLKYFAALITAFLNLQKMSRGCWICLISECWTWAGKRTPRSLMMWCPKSPILRIPWLTFPFQWLPV